MSRNTENTLLYHSTVHTHTHRQTMPQRGRENKAELLFCRPFFIENMETNTHRGLQLDMDIYIFLSFRFPAEYERKREREKEGPTRKRKEDRTFIKGEKE